MPDEITIPLPDEKEVTNVIERPNEAIPHVVEHAGRIAHLEEQQAQNVTRLESQIQDTRGELIRAIETSRTEQANTLQERIRVLEEKLATMEAQSIEVPKSTLQDIEQAETPIVDLVPEVEVQKQPEKYRGLRARRKERKNRT
jgi:hypothetical protein